jgi:hypothetical protein
MFCDWLTLRRVSAVFDGNTIHIFGCFVGKLEVLLDIHVLLDLEEDDGRSNQQAANKQSPAGGELGHKGGLFCIHAAKTGDVSEDALASPYTEN